MRNLERVDRWLGASCGLLALIVYLATIHVFPHPGEPARQLAQHLGLVPQSAATHPLWGFLVKLVALVPLGTISLRVALLSAVCGGLATWLMYHVVARSTFAAIEVESSNEFRARIASCLAGIAAALFLSFCAPIWVISNRAHPAAMDTLLLLLCVRLLLSYLFSGIPRLALGFAFACGVAIVENSTLIIAAPFMGLVLLWAMWRNDALKPSLLARTVLLGVLGSGLYVIAAWAYRRTQGYELYGYANLWQVIRSTWREQYHLLLRSVPKTGWLLVGVSTVVPWLAALAVARRALNGEREWTYYILHLAMTAIALGVLFNVRFAPWPLFRFSRMLVTPYLLAASLYGYLAAYWCLLFAEEGGGLKGNAVIPSLNFCLWVGLTLTAALRNKADAKGFELREIGRYTRAIVESLSGRPWLVTHGIFDDSILLAAYDLRQEVIPLDLGKSRNSIYLDYVAGSFSQPRLRNLAQIGIMPLLQGWLDSDEDVTRKLAVLVLPDLWFGSGHIPIPHGMVFCGGKPDEHYDPASLLDFHRQFWSRLRPEQSPAGRQDPLLGALLSDLHRQVSMAANNLGVFLEDIGDQNGALEAYLKAREYNPANLSVLLNLSMLVEKGVGKEQAESVRRDLKTVRSQRKKATDAWSLAQYDGYVRHWEAYMQIGRTWQLSGEPGLAAGAFKRALDLCPPEKKVEAKLALAGALLARNRERESEQLYHEILHKQPGNGDALLGLIRACLRKGQLNKARELLAEAEKVGVAFTVLSGAWATLHRLEGDLGGSRNVLEKAVVANPNDLESWTMLAEVLFRLNDEKNLETVLGKIEELEGGKGVVMALRAVQAFQKGDWEKSRKLLEEAVRLRPFDSQLYEMLARVEYAAGNWDRARDHALSILRLDPDSAPGNYILGNLQARVGRLELAADALLHSVERKETPEALNDLAWVLQEQGLYQEAEERVRAALRLDDQRYQTWDTLGVILLKVGRLVEAGKALERSLELRPDEPTVLLHMLELETARGEGEKARNLLRMLAEQESKLSADDQQKLNKLRQIAEKL